jgi:hypothetical protein
MRQLPRRRWIRCNVNGKCSRGSLRLGRQDPIRRPLRDSFTVLTWTFRKPPVDDRLPSKISPSMPMSGWPTLRYPKSSFSSTNVSTSRSPALPVAFLAWNCTATPLRRSVSPLFTPSRRADGFNILDWTMSIQMKPPHLRDGRSHGLENAFAASAEGGKRKIDAQPKACREKCGYHRQARRESANDPTTPSALTDPGLVLVRDSDRPSLRETGRVGS